MLPTEPKIDLPVDNDASKNWRDWSCHWPQANQPQALAAYHRVLKTTGEMFPVTPEHTLGSINEVCPSHRIHTLSD